MAGMTTRLSQADGVFAGCNAVMLLKLRLINLHETRCQLHDRLKRLQVERAQTRWSMLMHAGRCTPGAACVKGWHRLINTHICCRPRSLDGEDTDMLWS